MAVICFDFSGQFGRVRLKRAKKRIGQILLSQTHDRIDQSGDDQYRFPPLDFPRISGSTDTPLKDTGTHLDASLTYGMDSKSVWVGSNFIGARVQMLGTTGKGGVLKPIVPVRAKALFLPMSRRGQLSTKEGAVRKYWKGSTRTPGVRTLADLKKGYFEKGKLVPRNADFVLLQKVNIRPRRFLRMSPKNRQEIVDVIAGS